MTGKNFSMTGEWPEIIFVDENGHPVIIIIIIIITMSKNFAYLL